MALTGSLPFAASAQIVPTPGTSTHVIETQNGLPQVNVASPSGAGVSVNSYNQFDVQRAGAILNNSPSIVNTQQAGMINGNPNFGPDQSAQIIVNQVNSAAASQIGGYIEIAGNRAEFVLANPAGIVVDGGGFINTSRATLTTGQPFYGVDGALSGYNVSRGLITVQGAGLNASNVDQVDLISRALEANAAIHAKDLNVVTGANQVNRDTLAAALITGDGPSPSVSIDVGRLGGMYANRILLVGTERGVGVSNAGVLSAQAGDLRLRSNGQLTLSGKTNAKGELSFVGSDGVVNSGTTYGQQGVSVQTAGALINRGVLAAQRNLDVVAGGVNSTGTLGAGVNQDGTVAHGGDLTINASGRMSATGRNVAGGNGTFQGESLTLEGSRTEANGDLTLQARDGDVSLAKAQTSARGTLKASAAGALTNDGAQTAGQEGVTLTAGKLSNRGGKIATPGPLNLRSSGQLDNQNGTLVSDGVVTVHAGAIGNNEGTIQSAGAMVVTGESLDNTAGIIASLNGDGLSVTAAGQLINAAGPSTTAKPGGTIGGNGSVVVQAGALKNQGSITAKNDLGVASQSLDNRRGTVAAERNVTVAVVDTLLNDAGRIAADQAAVVTAATVDNRRGMLTAGGDATVTVGDKLINDGGRISAAQAAAVSAASLDNSGGAIDADRLTLSAKTLANRGGTIKQTGAGPISVAVAHTFDNTRGTLHSNSVDLRLAPASLINDQGKIAHAGDGTLRVRSGALSNQGGAMATNGAMDLTATALSNQAGRLSAQRQATLDVQSLDNRGGAYIGADSMSLNAAGRADNGGGTIEAHKGLKVTADSIANAAGAIKAIGTGALRVKATKVLENTEGGTVGGNGDVIVHAGELNNRGSITAKTDLHIASQSLDNRHGRVAAGRNAIVKVGDSLINDAGRISAAQAAAVSAASLDNGGGSISADELMLGATTLVNRGGKIAAPGPLLLQSSGEFDNQDGTLVSDATLVVRAGAIGNQAGTIQSAGAMTIAGTALDNTAGTIASLNGDGLSVTATGRIRNVPGEPTAAKPGGTIGGNGGVVVQAGALHNQGSITAVADLEVGSESVDNRGGQLAAGRNAAVTVDEKLINDGGSISAVQAVAVTAATLDNSGGSLDAGQLTLSATDLTNRRGTITQTGAGPISVAVTRAFDNTSGTLQTNSVDLSLAPTALINDQGKIAHAGTGKLGVRSGALSNQGGTIATNGAIDLKAAALSNQAGTLSAQRQATLAVHSLDNRLGAHIRADSVSLNVAGGADNGGGTLEARDGLSVVADSLANAAGVIKNIGTSALRVESAKALDNTEGGTIGGNGHVVVQAGALRNQGSITAMTDLEVDSSSLDNRRGKVAAGRNTTVTAGERLSNGSGTIAAGQAAAISAASLDNGGGSIEANALTLSATDLVNRGGTIKQTGTGPISVAVAGTFDNTSGTLHTKSADLGLAPASLINDQGKIAHAGGGTLQVRSGALSNKRGTLVSDGAVALSAETIGNKEGTIQSAGAMTLAGVSLDNTAGTIASLSGDGLSVTATGKITNVADAAGAEKAGGMIGGNGGVKVQAGTLNNQGSITAKTDLDVASESLDNRQGKLAAGRNATVNVDKSLVNGAGKITAGQVAAVSAASLDNRGGQLAAGRNATVNIGENLINDAGKVTAGQAVTVRAASLDNRRGTLAAGQHAVVNASKSLINDAGKIAAGQTATVNAVSLDNSGGSIGANELTLGATQLTNRGGKIAAPGPLLLQSSGQFDNQNGTLVSDATVTVRAGAIGNIEGTIQSAGAMALTGASLDNTAGTIASLGGDRLSVTAAGPLTNAPGASSVKPGGTIGGNGDVVVHAGALSNQGRFTAKTDLEVESRSLDNRRGTFAAGRNATVTVGEKLINGAGRITAGHAVTVNAASLENSGGAIDADQLTLSAKTIKNNDGTFTQTGTGPIDVAVEHTFDNTRGTLQTNSADLRLAPAALINDQGKIAHAGRGMLQVRSGALSNHGGTIATNGTLDLKAAALSNQAGTLSAQRHAALGVESLDNRSGAYIGAKRVSLQSAGRVDNGKGTIEAINGLTVVAESVANAAGSIKNIGTSALSVKSTKALDNTAGGTVGGNGPVKVAAGSVDNTAGSLLAADALTLESNGALTNARGLIQAKTHLHVDARGVVNNVGGQIEANGKQSELTLRGRGVDNTDGRVANIGTGSTTIDGGPSITNANVSGKRGAGTIGGNGDVTLTGRTQTNTRGGQILAGRDLTFDVDDRLDNTTGVLSAGRHATFKGANATLVNRSGSLRAEGVLSVDAASIDNTSGNVGNAGWGGGSVRVAAGTLGNQGGAIGSDQHLTVSAGTLSGDGSIVAGRRGKVSVGGDYTQTVANRIHANGDLVFTTRGRFTNQGVLDANGALRVQATNVDNTAGGRLNATSTTVDASGGTIDNAGRIEGGSVTTTSATLNNRATIVGQNVSIHADNINNAGAAAVIASAKQTDLYASNGLSNTGGATIFSIGDIGIAADGRRGDDGLLVHRVPNVLNDQSIIEAGGNVEVAAQTFTNARPAPTVVREVVGVEKKHQTKRAKYIGCPTGNAAPNHGVCSRQTWSGPYKTVRAATYPNSGIISRSSGANPVDRVLLVNVNGQTRTIYYETLTDNDNGTVTANYWVGYDPRINYHPATEYPTRNDAHKGYQRVEIARDVISTNQQDKVTHQTQPARMMAGGDIVMKHMGTLNNQHSTISAGKAIRIGDTHASGDAGSGGLGGPTRMSFAGAQVNNVGQTLYQYIKQDIISTYAWNEKINEDVGTVVQPSIELPPTAIGGTGGTIIANQSLAINVRDVNNQNVAVMNSTTGATGGTLGANRESAKFAGGVRSRVSTASSEIPVGNTVDATAEKPGEAMAGATTAPPEAVVGNPIKAATGTTVEHSAEAPAGTGAANPVAATTGATAGKPVDAATGSVTGSAVGNALEATVETTAASRVKAAEGNPLKAMAAATAERPVGATVSALQSVASATGALPDLALPVSGLFTIHTAPAQPYLVVTDPRLTSYTEFTSSDYMLAQLDLSPHSIQKRLGDGMFEQQTVRNQVTQLTGRTFLPGYASAEDAYRALMTNGVNVARQFGLTPGIALSAAQIDALTSDIVWLVEQNVALADGSTTRVLAPVVYLSKTRANDLQTTGALMAGDTVEVHATGSVTNSGVIKGRRSTVVRATDVLNRGGTIESGGAHGDANQDANGDASGDDSGPVAGTTIVSATQDVLNTSGRITGGRVAVLAGRDIANTTLVDADGVTRAAGVSNVTTSLVGQQGEIASTGDLAVRAGRDLTAHGAILAAGDDAVILAGRNITLDTVASGTRQSMHLNDQRHWEESSTTQVTSEVGAGGDLVMRSGNDTTLNGAAVSAGKDLAVRAGGNLSATTVVNEHRLDNVATDDRTRKAVSHTYDQRVVGTTLQAGRNVELGAGSGDVAVDAGKGNVTLTGSSVTSGTDASTPGGITIAATRDVSINEGQEQHDSYQNVQSRRGSFVSGSTINESHDERANRSVASTVSGDTVRIQAGGGLAVQGSNVVGTSDVGLVAGRDVDIGASRDKTGSASRYEKNEAGLLSGGGWGVTIGSRSLEQTEQSQTEKGNASVIGSSQGSVAIGAGRDVALRGAQIVAGRDIGIVGRNVTVDAAVDRHDTQRARKTEQAGVTVGLGGGLVTVGKAMSSAVKAGTDSGDARLAAVQGVAAAEIAYQNRGAIQNAAAAVADGANPVEAGGVQLQIGIGASHSEDASMTSVDAVRGSSIIGSGDVAIVATGRDADGTRQAGVGDITMVGATVQGRNVLLEANNDVTLKSAQHTQRDTSSNDSGGASAGIGIGLGQRGAGMSLFAGASVARGSGNGERVTQADTTVTAQEALAVRSGRDTTLAGAQASGDTVKAEVGRDLTMTSVQDTSHYAERQNRVSAGVAYTLGAGGASGSFSADRTKIDSNYASVKEQTGFSAGAGGFDVNVAGHTQLDGARIASEAPAESNTLTTNTLGFGDIQNQFSSSGSTVGVGVTGATAGALGAGSEASLLGGPTGAQTGDRADGVTRAAVSAGLITVTSDRETGVDSTAGLVRDTTNANQAVENTFDRRQTRNDLALSEAFGRTATYAVGQIADQLESNNPAFVEGGTARNALHAGVAAIGAAISGGNVGAAVGGSLTGDMLQSVAQPIIDQSVAQLPPDQQGAVRNALNAVVATVGGGVGGVLEGGAGGLVAGVGAGANNEVYNRQLDDNEKRVIREAANGDKEKEARLTRAACAEVRCDAEYKPGSKERNENYVSVVERGDLQEETAWVNRQKEAGLFNYTAGDKIADAVKSDPVGVAMDAAKVVIGGITAKTGATICATTGAGCVGGGGWMFAVGLSGIAEGGDGLYNRYNGTDSPGMNVLRNGFNQLAPISGDLVFDSVDLGFSFVAMRARVPLKMGIADGMNRPGSMFDVNVPRIHNKTLVPLSGRALPHGTTQGILFYGVGSKGVRVIDDVLNAGDKK